MTAGDEMCNLYIMYYSDRDDDDFRICADEEISGIGAAIPASSDDRLPPFHEEDNSISYSNGGDSKAPQVAKKGSDDIDTNAIYHRRPRDYP